MIASFRDPAGRLLFVDDRVVRVIQPAAADELKAVLTSGEIKNFLATGKLVRTEFLDVNASEKLSARPEVRAALEDFGPHVFVEHERIPFATFPYEWPPEMLYAAAELTIDIAERLLPEGFGLKDATPYNILFRGSDAVFIDLLSFERRDPLDQTWLPYAQFSRTFLLPLLVNKKFGVKIDQIFLAKRDGLDPEEVAQLCGPIQSIRPPFLSLVTLPVRLSGRALANDTAVYQKHRASSRDKAQFILGRIFKTLRRQLERLRPTVERTSVWSRYTEQNRYTDDYQLNKQRFVDEAIAAALPRTVLDVGCNTGDFSALAARAGASVVAIDYDPVVVGRLWQRGVTEKLDILPLAVNLARPTPSLGWRNLENPSFIERFRGRFEGVLMLAVLHHLLVSERIPLPEVMRLASELTTDLLVIEFVAPADPMFRRIARGRDHLHESLTREYFEEVSRRYFEIARAERLGDTHRTIYMLRRKPIA